MVRDVPADAQTVVSVVVLMMDRMGCAHMCVRVYVCVRVWVGACVVSQHLSDEQE